MEVLTSQALDSFNAYYYTDYKTVQRATQLVNDNRVKVTNFLGDRAFCEIIDRDGIYTVEIQGRGKNRLAYDCNCDEFGTKHICKHVIATIPVLSRYLVDLVTNSWQYRLSLVLNDTPRKASATQRQRFAILFGLKKDSYYAGSRFSLQVYTLKANDWPVLKQLDDIADPGQLIQRLDQDSSWRHAVQTPFQSVNQSGCVNLPPEGVAVANLMIQSGRYYYDMASFTSYLPLLGKLNAPLFLVKDGKITQRVQIIPDPVEIEAALARGKNEFILQAGMQVDGKMFTSVKESLEIISNDPAWALAGNYLLPVKNPQSLPLLMTLPLTIPEKHEEEFRERYLHEIAERIPIKGDVIAWEDVHEEPVPRLYLQDDEGVLRAKLFFGYGDYEVPADTSPAPVTMVDIPGSWGLVRVYRDEEREMYFYQGLTDPVYRLKRASRDYPVGTFELRARSHPFDFLMYSIPLLTETGFEIYGEEKLKSGKINRNKPIISLTISSGIDWFDLDAVVRYGDQEVALKDIRRAMRKREQYIKLADGSIGQIPDEWLERYRHLFELAEETEQGYRVADYHMPVVDELLAGADYSKVAEEYHQRRERLRSFEKIQAQDIPAGFVGELRPYQKVGLEWLHFLHDYNFGGCLADDMGLGKTIQVLAFLQSLREQGKWTGATLLVVPKSLIVNWQREGARFTPDLHFQVYMGNMRVKDTNEFTDGDIVLTTYGTMLRDIEVLKTYRFHYVILDESQAIKNPISQSSKAARLLNAEHKLVLTGTPVENNTFELWSQFTFLNPGLLGSLEYFKREFATPIESKQDQKAADLLRQLVYPFILRRTKEQVAPELPELTERILYADMAHPQRKLYNQTRDRYRGILLGMIENEGMDNVRMKILEGLLRLRQISIHPALVEPAYHGEAPKFDLLFETIENLGGENHKALIFSQFVETLKIVRKELDSRHIPYAYLDGQTNNRQQQVDLFQSDPKVRFFLISLKAGGLGLNLTAADYVIHLDPWWNPAVEMQASDRAHRIGQDKPVFVYKIITRESVEEKILELQDRKRDLVNQLISSETSFFKSLTPEDVKVLFS